MPGIQIKSSDRIFITGKTGFGKSFLVKHFLLPRFFRWVVYDYKHEIELPGAAIFYRLEDFQKQPGQPHIIYRPLSGGNEEFNQLCRQVFYRGNTMFVIDELAFHCSASMIQPYHDLIMRLGRSKNVGCINCTQRPVGTHNNILTQTEHFFIFHVGGNDCKKLSTMLNTEIAPKIEQYHFEYFNQSMEHPILCRPVKA